MSEVKTGRSLFAPEVVQTSAMDCGPASLKCLLEGFGVSVSYGRLREACQTDVDGTSIDTLEEVAVQLGLEAEQVMLPLDHLLLGASQALPAIVVVRLPQGVTHFLVAWRTLGGIVQVMDPATGRRWPKVEKFLDEVYVHQMPVPATDWREWAESEEFLGGIAARLGILGIKKSGARELTSTGLADQTAWSLSALDATTRMVESIAKSGGLRRGSQAERVLRVFYEKTLEIGGSDDPEATPPVPEVFWSASPAPADDDGTPQVMLRGAVLVRALGAQKRTISAPSRSTLSPPSLSAPAMPTSGEEGESEQQPLSPELSAALSEQPTRPLRELVVLLRRDGVLAPLTLVWALVFSAGAVVFQALLFRGLLELPQVLGPPEQRLGAAAGLLLFLTALFLLELPIRTSLLRLGRHLESRLRIAFQEKIPRLGDRYFHSRLTSDMAERSHAIPGVRGVPDLGAQLLRSTATLAFTTLGITWLDPGGAPLALGVAVISVLLPIGAQKVLAEKDLRIRTHAGALTRFYLDALLGLMAVRAHGAQRSLRREHEGLLVEWARSSLELLRASVVVEGLLSVAGMAMAGALLINHVTTTGESAMVLLLVYWALQLPALGSQVASVALRYPTMRNVTLRLLEPLGALEEEQTDLFAKATLPERPDESSRLGRDTLTVPGVALDFVGVTIRAGGHTLVGDVDLHIPPGSQVAIVGPSGAGKSSLVGALLGWTRPSSGHIYVDGEFYDAGMIEGLRRATAWVDPAVQLWNRSFLENLLYGSKNDDELPLGEAIEGSNLKRVLERLPEGLQTSLGEGGALVSGGEGQRVRLGRALLRRSARLVILDEAFRGLDRGQRRTLLARARQWWKGATILCVSHDITETMDFDEVVVIDEGRVVEKGPPRTLVERPESRYRSMILAEKAVTEGLWKSADWRRLRVVDGQVIEDQEDPT